MVASAPGRVNLIGEHTDYNGGPVLPVAVERRTVVAAAAAPHWEMVSTVDGVVHRIDPASLRRDWTDYIAGVIRVLSRGKAALRGARLAVASNLPIGAGLSSSAALTVAAARALTSLARNPLRGLELAEVAYLAEHDEVGVRVGRMDQTIAACATAGTALLFETGAGTITRVPFPGRLWVVETGIRHELVGGSLNQRRAECEQALKLCQEHGYKVTALARIEPAALPKLGRLMPLPFWSRLKHVVTETARTRAAARALAESNLAALGELLVAGHHSLRDDYQSSVPEADLIVESAVRRGAYGARLTGAGWGGAVLILAPEDIERRLVAEVQEEFREAFGRLPVVWATKASAGARNERAVR